MWGISPVFLRTCYCNVPASENVAISLGLEPTQTFCRGPSGLCPCSFPERNEQGHICNIPIVTSIGNMELLIPHCNSLSSDIIFVWEVNPAVGSPTASTIPMKATVMNLSYSFIMIESLYYCNTAAIFLRGTIIAAAAHLSWTEPTGWNCRIVLLASS